MEALSGELNIVSPRVKGKFTQLFRGMYERMYHDARRSGCLTHNEGERQAPAATAVISLN